MQAEGSGPSSSRGRGKVWQGDPVKTTRDGFRNSFGNRGMFVAIRRASSFVSNLRSLQFTSCGSRDAFVMQLDCVSQTFHEPLRVKRLVEEIDHAQARPAEGKARGPRDHRNDE